MRRKRSTVPVILALISAITSCNPSEKQKEKTATMSMENAAFPQGNKIMNNNFSGTAWLSMLVESDTVYNTQIGNVTFELGARTNWHYHPGGQILLVTDGSGYYQEKGKPVQLMHKGDVIKCSPNVVHWHGASPDSKLTHIAISPNMDKGGAVWLQPVTDEEYNSIGK